MLKRQVARYDRLHDRRDEKVQVAELERAGQDFRWRRGHYLLLGTKLLYHQAGKLWCQIQQELHFVAGPQLQQWCNPHWWALSWTKTTKTPLQIYIRPLTPKTNPNLRLRRTARRLWAMEDRLSEELDSVLRLGRQRAFRPVHSRQDKGRNGGVLECVYQDDNKLCNYHLVCRMLYDFARLWSFCEVH